MKTGIHLFVLPLLAAALMCLSAAAKAEAAGATDDTARTGVQAPPAGTPARGDDHEIEMDVHVGRAPAEPMGLAAQPAAGARARARPVQEPDCTAAFLARAEGRRAGRMPQAERDRYLRWCEAAARQENTAELRTGSRGPTDIAAPGADPPEIWCPPSSTQCYCWQGKHYNGCQNYASHCTSGLTCGPGGKVCHCDAN